MRNFAATVKGKIHVVYELVLVKMDGITLSHRVLLGEGLSRIGGILAWSISEPRMHFSVLSELESRHRILISTTSSWKLTRITLSCRSFRTSDLRVPFCHRYTHIFSPQKYAFLRKRWESYLSRDKSLAFLVLDAGPISSSERPSQGSVTMKIHDGLLPIAVFFFSSPILYRVAAISIPYPPLNTNNLNYQPTSESLNRSDPNILSLNLTAFNEPIDPFFGFTSSFRGPKLDENSALLNSIDAALQLALEETDFLVGQTIYRLDSHPEVQITINPDESIGLDKIPRRFAVWGLNIGIDLMIKTRNFQSAIFTLTHAGREVATIEYSVALRSISASTDTRDATRDVLALNDSTVPTYNKTIWLDENDPNSNVPTIDTSVSGYHPKVQVNFHLSGLVLSKYDICYAALDALRGLYSYKRAARVSHTTTPLLAADLELITLDANSPPRTRQNPPYFQAQLLMRALAQMPGYMLGLGKFMEVSMEISVDKTMVGWVLLRRVEWANGLAQTV